MSETKTELGLRLYDTANPPVSITRAAKLAGINPSTLREALAYRERVVPLICPLCHRFPGQRPAHGQGRTGKRQPAIATKGSAYRALGLPEAPTAHTPSNTPPRRPRPRSPQPVPAPSHRNEGEDTGNPPPSQPAGF